MGLDQTGRITDQQQQEQRNRQRDPESERFHRAFGLPLVPDEKYQAAGQRRENSQQQYNDEQLEYHGSESIPCLWPSGSNASGRCLRS